MGLKELDYWKKGFLFGFVYCFFSILWFVLIFILSGGGLGMALIKDPNILNILAIPIWPIMKIGVFLSNNNLVNYGLSSKNPLIEIFAFLMPIILSAIIIILIFSLIGYIIGKLKYRKQSKNLNNS